MARASDAPAAETVRAEVEAIAASGVLGGASRLPTLLRHLTEETLGGRGERLKAYAIATECLGRGEDFDPQTDSIVRVEVGRLRQALTHYYATAGSEAPFEIAIPKGQYRPVFVWRAETGEAASEAETEQAEADHRVEAAAELAPEAGKLVEEEAPGGDAPAPETAVAAEKKNGAFSVESWRRSLPRFGRLRIGLSILALAVFALLVLPRGEGFRSERVAFEPFQGPRVVLAPLANLSPGQEGEVLAHGMSVDLVTELSQFRWLSVFVGSERFGPGYTGAVGDAGQGGKVDYVVSGAIRVDGERVATSISLISAGDREVVWSKVYERSLSSGDLIALQRDVARSIALEIGRPGGLLTKVETGRASRDDAMSLSAYGCVLKVYHYWLSFAAAEHLEARQCLERAVLAEPDYADAHAALAYMYLDERRYGLNPRRGYDPVERAWREAKTALQLNPISNLAAQATFAVAIQRNDFDTFRKVGEAAIRRAPNNPELLADYGNKLSLYVGDWEQGPALVRRALELNADPPFWYYITPAFDAYLKGEYAEALDWTTRMGARSFFLYRVLRLACFHRRGDQEAMRSEISALAALGYADSEAVQSYLTANRKENRLWRRLEGDVARAYQRIEGA